MAKPDWQNQNYSKNAGGNGPSTMNRKIAGNSMSMHSKIGKPTVRNYADGGMVQDDVTGVDEAIARNASGAAALANENYGDGTTQEQRNEAAGIKVASNDEVRAAASEGAAKPQSFKEAFGAAKDGSTFEWNGKSYKKEYASSQAPRSASKAAAPARAMKADDGSFDEAERRRFSNASGVPTSSKTTRGRGIIDTSNLTAQLLPKK